MAETAVDEARVQVLGPVRVAAPGGPALDVPGVNGKALIVSLVLAKGAVVSVASLVEDIWQDDPPRNARAALQTLVSRVRAASGDDVIESVAGGYRLGVPPAQVDLWRPDAPRRGEPGADLGDSELAERLREVAEAERSRALTDRAARALAAGDAQAALEAAQTLADRSPFDEQAQLLLLKALAAAGRRTDALRAFAEFRERLADELGADPGPELVACHAALLREPEQAEPRHVVVGVRAAPNPLIGRDRDVAALERMLQRSRLTTILGPGGLGKTRLAQELAARAAQSTPGVVFVELASIRDPEDVPLAVAATLGIGEVSPGRLSLQDPIVLLDLRTRIHAALSERPTLLVLDNCEHVVEAVAYLADQLLAQIPGVRILATSRAPLQLTAESVYPLEPLGASAPGPDTTRTDATDASAWGPAVELFVERARAARPGASLPLDAVARLCDHLDGLPLAIELAAARIRSMSVDEIERRLGNRFALLRGGDRTAPERHRTLIAVIDWSWNLLSESERRMLRRLSRFPGGFSRDAAVEVAVPTGEQGVDEAARLAASDDLDALVTQSLVSVSENPATGRLRYRMLETVREFGDMALVDAGEDAEVEAAMGRWARSFALDAVAGIATARQAAVVRALDVEHDNLIGVLRGSGPGEAEVAVPVFAALLFHWLVRNQFREALSFAEPMANVMARVEGAEVPPEAADATALTLMYATLMSIGGALGPRDRGQRGQREQPDDNPLPDLPPMTLLRAGVRAGLWLRRLVRSGAVSPWLAGIAELLIAARRRETALAQIDRLRSSDVELVSTLANLFSGLYLENAGEIDIAVARATDAYRVTDRLGLAWMAGQAAQSLAHLSSQDDRPADAVRWAETANRHLAELGAVEEIRQFDWILAINRLKLGRPGGAREVFERFTREEEGQPGFEREDMRAIGWAGLAELAAAEGRIEESLRLYREVARLYERQRLPLAAGTWYLVGAAGSLAASVYHDAFDEHALASWRRLRQGARIFARLRGGEVIDRPVFSAALVGLGLGLLTRSTDASCRAGLELLALAERLHSRQDQPVLVRARAAAYAAERAGADALEAARARVAELPDLTACTARAAEVLRDTRI